MKGHTLILVWVIQHLNDNALNGQITLHHTDQIPQFTIGRLFLFKSQNDCKLKLKFVLWIYVKRLHVSQVANSYLGPRSKMFLMEAILTFGIYYFLLKTSHKCTHSDEMVSAVVNAALVQSVMNAIIPQNYHIICKTM